MTDNVHFLSHNNAEKVQHHNTFPQESELYFKVWERPLYFKGANQTYDVPSHKAIVRSHPNKISEPAVIGVVGKNYKVLHNKELYQSIERTFEQQMTAEQLKDVRVNDAVSYLGGSCIRDYVFPHISADIGSRNSDVAFRAIGINGYDGTSSFKFYSGAIDFFCTNGMVSGVFDMTVRRHTAGLQIPKLTDRLEKSIDIFYKQADQWRHWVGKQITDEEAKTVFEAMPNISERRVAQLERQFKIECDTHGRTVWALYSAATYYASHDEGAFAVRGTNNDHTASTLNNRELQVRSWTSTDEFLKLAA